jgi:lipid-A-disaccharide synthase
MADAPATHAGRRLSICLVAGEASGDLHGAALSAAMLQLKPDLHLWGVGGERMAAEGVELLYRSDEWAALGFSQVLAKVPLVLPAYLGLRQRLQARPPDLLVLIDFGAFNTRLGRRAKAAGIRTLYYFPPRAWDRNLRHPESLADVCHHVVTPFPWSAQLLARAHIPADYFGHPILDLIPQQSTAQARAALGLPECAQLVGLFPGSRLHEVHTNTAALLEAADQMPHPTGERLFVLSAAPGRAGDWVEAHISRQPRKHVIVTRDTWAALRASDVAILCSGSITLEAAAMSVPMVVFYRGTLGMALQYLLFYHRRLRFVAMPNILADHEIVPELITEATQPSALARVASSLLDDADRRTRMLEGLREVAALLGSPGATQKTAARALYMAES